MMNVNIISLPPKKEFYKIQRHNILNIIEKYLGLNEVNRSIIYCDINDYVKNQILALRSDIVSYFFTHGRDLFHYTWIDLVEFVFENMDYKISQKNILLKRDNKSTNTITITIVYTFTKNQNHQTQH